jgi:hypothetical protein
MELALRPCRGATNEIANRPLELDGAMSHGERARFAVSPPNHVALGADSPVRACATAGQERWSRSSSPGRVQPVFCGRNLDCAWRTAARFAAAAEGSCSPAKKNAQGSKLLSSGQLNGGCGPESSSESGNPRAARLVPSSVGDLLIPVLFRRQDYALRVSGTHAVGARVAPLSVLRFIPMGVFDDATVRNIGRRSTLRVKS